MNTHIPANVHEWRARRRQLIGRHSPDHAGYRQGQHRVKVSLWESVAEAIALFMARMYSPELFA